MKEIYNPSTETVSIGIKGEMYSVEAGKTIKVKKDVADKWLLTHGFLQIQDPEEVKEDAPEVKEKPAEEVIKKAATKK